MSSPMNLPPLPEPAMQEAIWHDSYCEWSQYHDASDPMPKEWDGPVPDEVLSHFTADQMRAYGEACAAAMVKTCLEVHDELRNHYAAQNRPANEDALLFAALSDYATAIRARGET